MADETRNTRKGISPMMVLPPVIFLGIAALFFFGMQRDNPDELPSTRVGKPAPSVDLAQLQDEPLLTDAVLQGEGVKLVNFWGTWCVACRAEHPQLLQMKEMGLSLHGINYNDKPGRPEAYLAAEGNPFVTQGVDASGRNNIDWGVYGAPETFIIDPDGVVTYRFAGPITPSILQNVILPEIEKAAQ